MTVACMLRRVCCRLEGRTLEHMSLRRLRTDSEDSVSTPSTRHSLDQPPAREDEPRADEPRADELRADEPRADEPRAREERGCRYSIHNTCFPSLY